MWLDHGAALRSDPRRTLVCLAAAMVAAMTADAARAQQNIAPFRLTDVYGHVAVGYRLDEWSEDNPLGNTFVDSPIWTEEVYVGTRSYVYHPAFLEMTIGGGPLFVQYGYESELGENSGSDTLFNFNAELDFLSLRAYPFTLFYQRSHPEITTGLSGRFLARTQEYGARGMLREPLLPVQTRWEAAHRDTNGSGFGTTVDETVDRIAVDSALPYGDGQQVRAKFNWSERDSASGNPGVPVQQSTITTSTAEFSGDNYFGDTRQVALNQFLAWYGQETVARDRTEQDLWNYRGKVRWDATERTDLNGLLNHSDSERTGSFSRRTDLDAGVNHDLLDNLQVSAHGRFNREKAPGFTRDVVAGRATATYRRPLPFGSVGLSATLGQSRTDQEADADRVTIFDESVTLTGADPVPLSQEFVDTDTVVVTNVPQTQTFVVDQDYRLVTLGSVTTIERIITGSIADGQTVLVTYDVVTGGTFEYDTTSQSLSATLGLFKRLDLYVRFSDRANDIIAGLPTTPLNDIRRMEFGGRLYQPLPADWSVNAEYRYIDQDEDISPYVSKNLDLYLQTGRYWNTSARVGVQRLQVDNEFSPEDVDRWQYTLSIVSWLPGGVVVGYDTQYSEDDGGTIYREDRRHAIRVDWRYRQFQFFLRGEVTDIIQGDSRRETKRVTAEVRRLF